MNIVGRLFLVATLLTASLSSGAVACACPPLLGPSVQQLPDAVGKQAATPACPMTKRVDCRCCDQPQESSSKSAFSTPASKCQIAVAGAHRTEPILPGLSVEVPIVLGSAPLVVVAPATVVELSRPRHLVVHRTRPPNPRLHGLRAPPTR